MKKYTVKTKLYEMANLTKEDTGLDCLIWIMPKTGKEKHGARIKVEVDKDNRVPVTISDDPKWVSSKVKISQDKLNKIKKWVKINHDVLIDYWNSEGEMSLKSVFTALKKVK